jgi:DUF4097 and DUF4098 domain-containing protein YvlB
MGTLMSTWKTPDPISLIVDIGAGDIQVTASDRDDTVVDVKPSKPSRRGDAEAARATSVDFANSTLSVRSPRKWTRSLFGAGSDSTDVRIELPSGSHVRIDAGLGSVTCIGALGECHVKTGFGEIVIGEASPVRARSGAGNISVRRSTGRTEVSTGSGRIRIETLSGDGAIRSSHGDIRIGSADAGPDRDVLVRAAAGRIDIDQSTTRLEAKTSAGDVRIGAVTSGAVNARTAYGAVDVGIGLGVAAWLDLNTSFGNVRNALDDTSRPGPNDTSVEVTARTAFGDITVRRAEAALAGAQKMETTP